MTTRLADASTIELRLPRSEAQTTPVTKIRIFKDSAGGNWIWILAPLTAETANKLRGLHETGEIELEVEPLPDDDFRALEMAWLQENYSEIAAQYPGQ
ncbi:MAG: hypothetical protein Q8O86_04710 [Dehalococcoidia bacterium]|nr:hypothetical protein [Dehalococcoidia bacterium]